MPRRRRRRGGPRHWKNPHPRRRRRQHRRQWQARVPTLASVQRQPPGRHPRQNYPPARGGHPRGERPAAASQRRPMGVGRQQPPRCPRAAPRRPRPQEHRPWRGDQEAGGRREKEVVHKAAYGSQTAPVRKERRRTEVGERADVAGARMDRTRRDDGLEKRTSNRQQQYQLDFVNKTPCVAGHFERTPIIDILEWADLYYVAHVQCVRDYARWSCEKVALKCSTPKVACAGQFPIGSTSSARHVPPNLKTSLKFKN